MTTATAPDAAAAPTSPQLIDRLPVGLKLGWATGAFGVALLMNGVGGLILLFASTILGVDPWLAGLVIFVSKLFDVVTDPVVGMWSDGLRSANGRRRPFLSWGAILSGLSFALIFSTPGFDDQYLTAFYLFMVLCLYAFGYTLYNIPYMSMPAEMTDSYHERSSIHAYRMVFVSLGAMVAGAGVKYALDYLGSTDAESWTVVGIICGVLITTSMLIAYFTTATARFTNAGAASTDTKWQQVRTEFGAVSGNRHFVRLIGVKFSQLMGVQTMAVALAFFFLQYLQRDFSALGTFFLIVSISTIIFAPLLVKFSKIYGKKAAYYVAAAVNITYALSWSFSAPGEPDWALALRAAVVGIAFGGNVIMAMSMLTDIINDDAARTGVRREGAFTALYSFVEKLTGALGPLIVGFALTFAGFNKNLPLNEPQGANVDTALLLAVSWLPAFFNIVAVILLSGYDLTEKDVGAPAEGKPA